MMILLNDQYMLLLIALMLPVYVASYSIIGEKETRSLELLLRRFQCPLDRLKRGRADRQNLPEHHDDHGAAVALVLINASVLWLAVRLFQRKKILTRWE